MVAYNGCVNGYFKGKQGLRQGDPLSSYHFVIAMNCLSQMLNKEVVEGFFSYHHQCSRTKLTHLCFADDLLMFLDCSLASLQRVLQILKEFELRSGLGEYAEIMLLFIGPFGSRGGSYSSLYRNACGFSTYSLPRCSPLH